MSDTWLLVANRLIKQSYLFQIRGEIILCHTARERICRNIWVKRETFLFAKKKDEQTFYKPIGDLGAAFRE